MSTLSSSSSFDSSDLPEFNLDKSLIKKVVRIDEHPVEGGGFSDIYRGRIQGDNRIFAVKAIRRLDVPTAKLNKVSS